MLYALLSAAPPSPKPATGDGAARVYHEAGRASAGAPRRFRGRCGWRAPSSACLATRRRAPAGPQQGARPTADRGEKLLL